MSKLTVGGLLNAFWNSKYGLERELMEIRPEDMSLPLTGLVEGAEKCWAQWMRAQGPIGVKAQPRSHGYFLFVILSYFSYTSPKLQRLQALTKDLPL